MSIKLARHPVPLKHLSNSHAPSFVPPVPFSRVLRVLDSSRMLFLLGINTGIIGLTHWIHWFLHHFITLLQCHAGAFANPCLCDGGQPFAVVQPHSHVRLFVNPWTAPRQASLSFTIFLSVLELMSIESVMTSNHLILCFSLLTLPSISPSIRVFSSESVLPIRWPNIGASASASVLPMNIQD